MRKAPASNKALADKSKDEKIKMENNQPEISEESPQRPSLARKTADKGKEKIKKEGERGGKALFKIIVVKLAPYIAACVIVVSIIIIILFTTMGLRYFLRKAPASETPGGGGPIGEGATKIVAVAQAELDKGVCEVPMGSNCGPDVQKYTGGRCEAWCADFVSWVYKEAGYPFVGGASGGWRIAGGGALQGYFSKNEIFFSPGEKDPQPGDVIGFKASGNITGHVGIVKSYSGGKIITIEGNASNCVRERNYTITNPKIRGFGRLKQFD